MIKNLHFGVHLIIISPRSSIISTIIPGAFQPGHVIVDTFEYSLIRNYCCLKYFYDLAQERPIKWPNFCELGNLLDYFFFK